MKIERTGYTDSRRIVGEDGAVLAMCERYTSGFWAVHDKDTDRKLCAAIHSTPRKAMQWFEAQATYEWLRAIAGGE